MAFNVRGREVGKGLYQLPHHCTVHQPEALAQRERESVWWIKGPGNGGRWMVESDLLAVLASMRIGRGMTRLVSKIAQEVEGSTRLSVFRDTRGIRGTKR